MCELLRNIYGEKYCIPSFCVGNLCLDCLVIINDILIDVEYDGVYWHQNRGQKDAARNAILLKMGYKILRIKGNNKDILPTTFEIKNAINSLVNGEHNLIFIDMNDKKNI